MTNSPIIYNYQRPWLYEKQKNALFCPERYSWIEASTKAGKTFASMVWLFEEAMRQQRGINYWWVAPTYPVAKIAFRRYKRSLPPGTFSVNEAETRLTLNANGSVLWFKSADQPDNLYGEDVGAAVNDEASRMKEDSWHAVRSTLTYTRGRVRNIGNVRGRGNWFFKGCRKAESGLPGHSYHMITAYDAAEAGIFPVDEIDDARRVFPEQKFNELYLCIPGDDGGNPFGYDAIQSCKRDRLSSKPPVCWGWDLAKHVDWTVGVGLDEDGEMCRFERFQKPWEVTMMMIINMVGDTPAVIDSTGVGDPVVELIQKACPYVEGYKFTSGSKQQLMEGLAVGIQQKKLGLYGDIMLLELEQFEYEYTRTGVFYQAPEGLHDDCVMALALANYAHNHKPERPFFWMPT